MTEEIPIVIVGGQFRLLFTLSNVKRQALVVISVIQLVYY